MPKYSVKKPFTILVAVILVLVLGFVSLTGIQTDLLPAMNLPYLMVITTYPGASPEQVEADVTKPLENALSTLNGVKNVTSQSNENYSLLFLEYQDDTDMDSAMVKASTAVNQLGDALPDMASTPTLMEISPDMMATQYIAVDYDGMDIYELSDYVSENVLPKLERVDGVASVSTTGLVEKSVQITLDQEKIDAVTTLIDPEIALLAQNRERFEQIGVEVLAPYAETAELCFDKFKMSQFLAAHGIPTPDTWGDYASAMAAVAAGELAFPVFVKPRTGSGSVGARKVYDADTLKALCQADPSLIIQRLMTGDLDADVYIDTISHRAVSAFSKRKLETKLGGASKTVSFKDEALVAFIQQITQLLKFNGPVDMDFFFQDGVYYLSEVNPRFGGAYLHAYGAGVDFVKLIKNNLNGVQNTPVFGNYEENVVMMMYDSVVITKLDKVE